MPLLLNIARPLRALPLLAVVCLFGLSAAPGAAKAGFQDARIIHLFNKHCARCHGADRLGRMGPALLPQNLKRLNRNKAGGLIAKGRIATQMPAFGARLTAAQIAGLVDYIYTPLDHLPRWGRAEIMNSRKLTPLARRIDKPIFKADPLNLFVVVESGDHHVTILDGDKFEPLARFASHFALHGGPKFTPDGRYVFFASRDGWVTKYDLYALRVVADVRAGINTRNIAISADGRHVAVANYLPHSLVILRSTDLAVEKIFDVRDRWKHSSRVSAVYQARPRNSFIAALKDVPEIWEIATDPKAPPVYEGFVHSHEKSMQEALASTSGLFARRRIAVKEPLDDFFFDQSYRNLIGSSRDGKHARVVNLNTGQTIASIALPSLPHMGSGITFTYKGRRVMASPHLREGKISVIDMTSWKLIKTIKTQGPGFFMRSHENTPYAWAGVFFGPHRDLVNIIDKRTLKIVKTLRPVPGKTAAHVEFDRSGRHALLSIWDMDGAVIVYDAARLKEVKRLPMVRPAGKYNVYNKITFSEGTSH